MAMSEHPAPQPIESDAFYQLLGLAMRAGMVTLGEDGVSRSIACRAEGTKDAKLNKSAKRPCGAALVLVDAEASANTKKRFQDSCAYHGIELMITQAGRLGQATGKPGRMSASVAPGTLCERLRQLAHDRATSQEAMG